MKDRLAFRGSFSKRMLVFRDLFSEDASFLGSILKSKSYSCLVQTSVISSRQLSSSVPPITKSTAPDRPPRLTYIIVNVGNSSVAWLHVSFFFISTVTLWRSLLTYVFSPWFFLRKHLSLLEEPLTLFFLFDHATTFHVYHRERWQLRCCLIPCLFLFLSP